MTIKRRSEILGLEYIMHENGSVLFEDGVTYSRVEMMRIPPKEEKAMKVIHMIKKVFKKSVIVDSKPEGFVWGKHDQKPRKLKFKKGAKWS